MERSNEMSGESLRVMIVRGFSMVTCVWTGGNLLVGRPAVVERFGANRLVASRRIGDRTAPSPALLLDHRVERIDPARELRGRDRRAPADGGRTHRVPCRLSQPYGHHGLVFEAHRSRRTVIERTGNKRKPWIAEPDILRAMITALILADGPPRSARDHRFRSHPSRREGLVADAVVLSREHDPRIARVAEAVGAAFVVVPSGHEPWAAGAAGARRDWVLCLGAGDLPSEGWMRAVDRFVALAPPDRRFGRLRRRHSSL
jgi:hypothetical protein